MPPRIVHIPRCFATDTWGGTEAVVRALVEAAPHHGCQAAIVTSQAQCATPRDVLGGAPVLRLPHSYGEWPLSAARRAAFERKGGNLHVRGLASALDTLGDVKMLHLHTGGRFGAQALRLARRRGWPCVLTLHGGHFCIPPDERRALVADHTRGGLPWGRALSWWWGARDLLRAVDAVICVGIDEYNAARAALPGQRVELIPGGVDPQRFAHADGAAGRRQLGINDQRTLIGCLARLDVQKDQRTLIDAWRRLTPPCDLVLIGGESSPGYAAELRQAAAGASGQLHLVGNVAPEAVPNLLAACEVLALPSRHEPFGLAVLEAWAAQRPLVASAVGGPAWLLADGAGRLVPPGDSESLAAALAALLADPRLRAQQIEAGTKALREHIWERRLMQTYQLYHDCIAKHRTAASGTVSRSF